MKKTANIAAQTQNLAALKVLAALSLFSKDIQFDINARVTQVEYDMEIAELTAQSRTSEGQTHSVRAIFTTKSSFSFFTHIVFSAREGSPLCDTYDTNESDFEQTARAVAFSIAAHLCGSSDSSAIQRLQEFFTRDFNPI